MRTSHASISIATAFALALGVDAGDRPAFPPRVAAAAAAGARTEPGVVPRFALFGWLSPPTGLTDEHRIRELAGAGMNVALPAYDDSGKLDDNLRRLDLSARHGVRCIVWDSRFRAFFRWDPDSPEGQARIDSIVADYRDHPGFFGYYLGDEPSPPWTRLSKLHAELRERDPAHPAWNNLLGIASFPGRDAWLGYTRGYLDSTSAAVLCNDHYDFLENRDRGQFVENAAGLHAVAREYGLPFWSIVLLSGHGTYRVPSAGELRWQASHLLAYGARGVGYFTYWTPLPDSVWRFQPAIIGQDGTRTAWYEIVSSFNRRLRAAGETLADLTWLATEHAGSVPIGGTPFAPDEDVAAVEGRAALGTFADRDGRLFLLVASSDSVAARTIRLTFGGVRRVSRLGDRVGAWEPVAPAQTVDGARVAIDLEAGGFALLRVDDPFGQQHAGRAGPLARVEPNPARGELRLFLTRLAEDARLELLDASGRRVWSRALPAEEVVVTWRGERDEGGTAPAGLYFARIEDRRGVVAARVTWLGH